MATADSTSHLEKFRKGVLCFPQARELLVDAIRNAGAEAAEAVAEARRLLDEIPAAR